ncbi:energy-coupling factor transporter transmembrane component T family protein [Novibacillus thermophilus]|uniref:Cobalt transporter n=1 Tax=Novibacillus thermophilus TaxID=1471761 RepID=A0A1U9K3M1_9BACL|nr:energy-coupling factor transporter transmembrane component T [Novibacillus thermophilus]AQS54639.1 hypothetical protein B0W44_01410 [Novibacillus thermophilus]
MNLYEDKNRWVHRLDPRSKIAFAFVYTLLLFVASHPLYVFTLTLIIGAVGFSASAFGRLKKIYPVLLFVFFFTIFLWTLFVGGETKLIGWIDLEAVLFGVTAALRILNVIFLTVIFFATTRVEELTAGLVTIGLPYKVGFVFSMAMRLVPTFVGAVYQIIQAQRSRGLDLESGSVFVKLRRSVPLVVPVLLTSLRNTNQLAMALESKGFGVGKKRTSYLKLKLSQADKLVLAVVIAMLTGGGAIVALDLFELGGVVR